MRESVSEMKARLYGLMPKSREVCLCGHYAQAHVFSTQTDDPRIYSTCRGVNDLRGPGDPRNHGCNCKGWRPAGKVGRA